MRLSSLLLFGVIAFATAVRAQSGPEFHPEDYGAVADDGLDDRAAIQAALNAAGAAGGGTVVLGPGTYHVLVIGAYGLSAAAGSGQSFGYEGVTVPPGCTFTGSGPDVTSLALLAGDAIAGGIGDGILNGGYRTALTNFGAGGGIRIANLRVFSPDVAGAPTGNLIGLAHADGVVISNVVFGSSHNHALEINLSRNVTVENCQFNGQHYTASTVQLDIGYFGAKSLRPTGTMNRDLLFRRCSFTGRDADNAATAKVIELSHTSSACILRNVAFEDCLLESLPYVNSVCVAPDNPPAQEISGLRFERCQFVGKQAAPSSNGMLQLLLQGTQILEDVTIRDCRFTGLYSQAVVIVSAYDSVASGWATKRRILIEGNTFAPTLDRPTPYSGGAFRLLSVAACNDAIIRRNLFEVPPTAQNLSLTNGLTCCQVANNLDVRVEDNVFTWSHPTQAAAPFSWSRLIGICVPVTTLEQNGIKNVQRITGNTLLYPQNGIYAGLYMPTYINTTAWAAGGQWVGGLIAGNYASGTVTTAPWLIHWDLSSSRNIGQVLPASNSLTRARGWYPANGAALTTLDSGRNQLPRVNAVKLGYATNLPATPGMTVRLHGPMVGEGLLADYLAKYNGSTYRGSQDNAAGLAALPVATLLPGDLRVVRSPLTVFRWEAAMAPEAAPPDALEPLDKLSGTAGYWVPLDSGMTTLPSHPDYDPNGGGIAPPPPPPPPPPVLCDPAVSETLGTLTLCVDTVPAQSTLRFRCPTGAASPPVTLLCSEDLIHWTTETSSETGAPFSAPAAGTIQEVPVASGREIRLTQPTVRRRFWKLSVGK